MVAAMSLAETRAAPSDDDTLLLMFMSSHPSLSPGAAIPLTLRAVGGLTTAEVAAAFLVPGDDGATHHPGQGQAAG